MRNREEARRIAEEEIRAAIKMFDEHWDFRDKIDSSDLVTIPNYCMAYCYYGIGRHEIIQFLTYLREKTNVRFEVDKNDLFQTKLHPKVITMYLRKVFPELLIMGEAEYTKS